VAVIKRADADRVAREALVLDLADIERRSRGIRTRAERESKEMIAEARAERERLLGTAADEGRRKGHAEGFEKGRAEGAEQGRAEAFEQTKEKLEAVTSAWTEALRAFVDERDEMIRGARADIVTLARIVAEQVTKRAVEIDPGVIESQLEAALRSVAKRTSLRVSVSADDEPVAREALPSLAAMLDTVEHAEITVDPALSAGSCVVRTAGGGVIDARVERQLARIVADAMPDAAETAPEPAEPTDGKHEDGPGEDGERSP